MWQKIKTYDPDEFIKTLNDLNIKPNEIIKFGVERDIRIPKEIYTFRVYVEDKPKKKRTAKNDND